MAEVAPIDRIDKLAQDKLNTSRILKTLVIRAEPSADADAMRIAHHRRQTVYITYQKICNLAPDAGQLGKSIYIARNLAAVLLL